MSLLFIEKTVNYSIGLVRKTALLYTQITVTSVSLRNRDPISNPTLEDEKRISNFYTGTYELDIENNQVFHMGLQSSVASVIGQRMQRDIMLLPDGRLKISGRGLKEQVTLVWSKVR